MSFIGRLFSAPEQIVKVTDAIIKSGDALVFTDEERAEFNLKQQKFILDLHKSGDGSNLNRRLLSVMVAAVFLSMTVMACFLIVIDHKSAPVLIGFVSDVLLPSFGGVMLFYFGHGINRDRK